MTLRHRARGSLALTHIKNTLKGLIMCSGIYDGRNWPSNTCHWFYCVFNALHLLQCIWNTLETQSALRGNRKIGKCSCGMLQFLKIKINKSATSRYMWTRCCVTQNRHCTYTFKEGLVPHYFKACLHSMVNPLAPRAPKRQFTLKPSMLIILEQVPFL